MESNVARVLPWAARHLREKAETRELAGAPPALRPIEGIVVVIDDGQLEALANLFAMSPVRQAMTFEAYLAVKGFARGTDR